MAKRNTNVAEGYPARRASKKKALSIMRYNGVAPWTALLLLWPGARMAQAHGALQRTPTETKVCVQTSPANALGLSQLRGWHGHDARALEGRLRRRERSIQASAEAIQAVLYVLQLVEAKEPEAESPEVVGYRVGAVVHHERHARGNLDPGRSKFLGDASVGGVHDNHGGSLEARRGHGHEAPPCQQRPHLFAEQPLPLPNLLQPHV